MRQEDNDNTGGNMENEFPFEEPDFIFHETTDERICWSDAEAFVEYDLLDKDDLLDEDGNVFRFRTVYGNKRGADIFAAVLAREVDADNGIPSEYDIKWFSNYGEAEGARQAAAKYAWRITGGDWPFYQVAA